MNCGSWHRHLHFVQSTEPLEGGGLGRAAYELSFALRKSGRTSLIVATGPSTEAPEPGLKIFGRFGPTRGFFAPTLQKEASTLVSECDIVHGHGFYVATNWILGREARRQRRPLVYHPHGMFEPWILSRSRGKKRLAHLFFENANFAYTKLWRALTGKEADQIRAQGITASVIVCPNGIDLSIFDSLPDLRLGLGKMKTRRELLFLARLHPKKGLPLLIKAWARLPIVLRAKWRVVIAGPDELGHRAEIEEQLRAVGLQNDFEFTGSVSGAAKLAVLARADAFILPSHSEGFSVAILEAMACRLPVLATHACNFPSLASEGGGWCVPDSVEPLCRAMEELMREDETGLRQRGDAARALIEARYTWASIAAQLAEACESLQAS